MELIKSNVWEIEKEIHLHGQLEWRSEKNLDDFVRNNTFDKDISIVGYITPKTVEKWGLHIRGYIETNNIETQNFYVGVRKNKNLCYLQGHGIPRPIDYSRYYR